MTSSKTTTRPNLPQRLRSSPWLVFSRPPMDYFSLPLHPTTTTYFSSPLQADDDDEDETHSALSSHASTSTTTSSQRSFYDNSFNYLNYRSGSLEVPNSPSFGLEDEELTVQHIENVNELLLLSPSSTVSSSLTLADQSSFHSPSFSSSASSSSHHQHEPNFPITPPQPTFTLTLPPSRLNKANPHSHLLLEFRSLSGTPSRPPKKKEQEVHVDTPYPTEQEELEEEEDHRGRGLERRGGWLGDAFELRLEGGEGIASRRS
ncbi:hypothetical protein BDY24DRAFT_401095 [Mrakia frigida]|uniref:uncharacterized protein n=1 Tax=Mrakia frigida TaxID=29902 RepID=UPI003FCC23EC